MHASRLVVYCCRIDLSARTQDWGSMYIKSNKNGHGSGFTDPCIDHLDYVRSRQLLAASLIQVPHQNRSPSSAYSVNLWSNTSGLVVELL
jgi:hypothetical protein